MSTYIFIGHIVTLIPFMGSLHWYTGVRGKTPPGFLRDLRKSRGYILPEMAILLRRPENRGGGVALPSHSH